MRKEKYIVVGRHESGRGSWSPGRDIRGVQSAHRAEGAAWRAARVAERHLGNCDGADSLTDVLVRAPDGLLPGDELDDELEDTYDFEALFMWAAITGRPTELSTPASVRRPS